MAIRYHAPQLIVVALLVCSVGPSGVPSCIGPIISERRHPDWSASWNYDVEFLEDGSLVYLTEDGTDGPYQVIFP